jgi:hypothetical protein
VGVPSMAPSQSQTTYPWNYSCLPSNSPLTSGAAELVVTSAALCGEERHRILSPVRKKEVSLWYDCTWPEEMPCP